MLAVLLLLFTADVPWLVNFDQARTQAHDQQKFILLNFSGSDWCAPCIKLKKEIFEKEEFLNYAADHLVLLRADFPRQKKNQLAADQVKHNEMLAEKYNPQGKFPYTLLLKSDGTVVHTWDGFQSVTPEQFVQQVRQFSGE